MGVLDPKPPAPCSSGTGGLEASTSNFKDSAADFGLMAGDLANQKVAFGVSNSHRQPPQFSTLIL